jgi:iron(III) transport system ATP-binding protein
MLSRMTRPDRPDRWGQRGTAGAAIAARLTLDNVHLSFGEKKVLKGISMNVEPGDIVCLLGHSGCGKTSLLRTIAGLEQPDQGNILFDKVVMTSDKHFVLPEKRGVGLMFQDFALFPHMNVLANVMFGLRKLDKKIARQEAMHALRRVGMESFAQGFPHDLSGGEQQRVALARAIVPRPRILLMDEPFSGLDQRLRDKVRQETRLVIKETRATTILVTHDPEEAMRIGDQIALMDQGRIVQFGPARELYFKPVNCFAANFFSQMNCLETEVRQGRAETPFGSFPAPERAEEGELVSVFIRYNGLLPTHQSCGAQGRVVSTRFAGDVDILEIAVKGLEQPVWARVQDTGTFKPRDEIGVQVRPDHVFVFQKDN